jgi:outer membrane protein OmpA-like peptidoglycan-associated protein
MYSLKFARLMIALIASFMILNAACATKKYVRNQVNDRVTPVEGRATELEEGQKDLKRRAGDLETNQGAMQNQIKDVNGRVTDVDSRATAGIDQAKQKANDAQNQALAAQDDARLSNSRVDNLDTWEEQKQVVVNFSINQSRLTSKDKAALDDLAEQVKQQKGYLIEIRGFTDGAGDAYHNQLLSEARAKAVFQYLASAHDIPAHKMNIVGFGKIKPVADNHSRQGRAENRRVEVKLLTNAGIRRAPSAQPQSSNAAGSGGQVGALRP